MSAAPAIQPNGVLNASGYQALLAPDTVFVIFGSGMGPSTIQVASAPNYPNTLDGTSISFTPSGGGPAITAKMIYTLDTQIAGLLPSSIAPGTYQVTVTYNNATSAAANVTVVARSFGIATANSAGTGPAQATIGNVNSGISLVRMTGGNVVFGGYTWTLAPAHPGDTLVLWGTGGGADPANDTGGSSGNQTSAGNFKVTVDGTSIVPQYAGTSSGYPGLWQINFELPQNIGADCFASVQVSAGGQLSNQATVAIAAPGSMTCSSTVPSSTLSQLDSGTGEITWVGLGINQTVKAGGTSSLAGGVIDKFTTPGFLLQYDGPKVDACKIIDASFTAPAQAAYTPVATLDAGTITLSGGGENQTLQKIVSPTGSTYVSSNVTAMPGATYKLTATGGADVGPFEVSTTMPDTFTVTNYSSLSSINRSTPLQINWMGSGFDRVGITIETETLARTSEAVTVYCDVPASAGTYTIPAAALAYLIPGAGYNVIRVQSYTTGGALTAGYSNMIPNTTIQLASGAAVPFGAFFATIIYEATPMVQ